MQAEPARRLLYYFSLDCQMEDRRGYEPRRRDDCPHELTIHDLRLQIDRISKFVEEIEPLMNYLQADIERSRSKTKMYEKITEHVLGAGVLFLSAAIGTWLMSKIRSDIGL
jgi:hypothetical protein